MCTFLTMFFVYVDSGGYGTVYKVKKDGEIRAVKVMKITTKYVNLITSIMNSLITLRSNKG